MLSAKFSPAKPPPNLKLDSSCYHRSMKKVLLAIIALLIIVFLAVVAARVFTKEDDWICQSGEWVKHGNPSTPKPTGICKEWSLFGSKKEEVKTSILPNPASQNCLDKGGSLEIVKETAGEIGICKFNDGTQCEEWQFFRNECLKGQYQNADTSHSYSGVISKTNTGYSFKDESGTVYSLTIPAVASKELMERLKAEITSKETVTIVASETPLLSKILLLKSFVEK